MIEIIEKYQCCGCTACVQKCPKQCIAMFEDNEGFLYPKVDIDNCIECGLCEKVCPMIDQPEPQQPLNVYAAKNINEEIRRESSSGGVFTLLAEKIINQGGVVFGARFNEKWEIIHSYAETIDGLAAFRGSKYVQSKIGNSYKEVIEFLKGGRAVLFSGTPCQIAGLKRFLGKDYNNLLTVDFICHGVPSPKVWRIYLQEIIRPKGGDGKNLVSSSSLNESPSIESVSFRDKTNGWKKFGFVIWGKSPLKGDKNMISLSGLSTKKRDPNLIEYHRDNIYMRGFLSDLYLRPSCHSCPTKQLKSGSDLTIADFWGIQRILPEFDDDGGVSLIIANSSKGRSEYKKVGCESIEIGEEVFQNSNKSLSHSVVPHKYRSLFFQSINDDADILLHKLIPQLTRDKIDIRIKNLAKKIVKSVLSNDNVEKLKQRVKNRK